MRTLHAGGEPSSTLQIAVKAEGPLGVIAYHIRVLRELGAVERVSEEQEPDSVDNFYESRVGGDPSIEAMLEESGEDDGGNDDEGEGNGEDEGKKQP